MTEVAELELPTQENVHTDLRTLFQGAIRVALEVVLEEEIQALVGARKWARQAQRVDSRNGTYLRRLITSVGAIDLKVPRSREGGSAGGRVFDRYKRRSAEVDDTMVAAYVHGASTRDIGQITEALMGEHVSRSTVSRAAKTLGTRVEDLRKAPIEGPIPYLFLDATFLDARWAREVENVSALVAYGVGLDLAAIYLSARLRAMGLRPAIGEDFLQSFEMAEYAPDRAKVRLEIGGRTVPSSDFALLNTGVAPRDLSRPMELVFAGWGVDWPERGIDDLAGLDLRGKGVVVLDGAPWKLPDEFFGPDQIPGKAIAAAARGAALLVLVSDEFSAKAPSRQLALFKVMAGQPVAYPIETEGKVAMAPILVISSAAFDRMLAGAEGGRYAELPQRLAAGSARRGPMPVGLRLSVEATPRAGQASNVVAAVTGADSTRRDQWVLLTAHYDHLGTRPASPGQDPVFHGADDNASGTAVLLEVARQLTRGAPPRRSVLIVLTAGEERSLLGSESFARRMPMPADRLACAINVDMVGRSTGSVQAGAPTSPGLLEVARRLGDEQGIEVRPEEHPEFRGIYLTDTFHFARKGIPTIQFDTGMHDDYHSPSDVAGRIRYGELARIAAAVTALTLHCAHVDPPPGFVRPAWFVTAWDR